jgi:hypothetical protein
MIFVENYGLLYTYVCRLAFGNSVVDLSSMK